MYFATFLISISIIGYQSLFSNCLAIDDLTPPAGYERAVPTFSGTVFGEPYEINGTVQDVLSTLTAKYPGKDVSAELLEQRDLSQNSSQRETAIEKRAKEAILCTPVRGQPWRDTTEESILSGIQSLYNLGNIRVHVPRRSCILLTCRQAPGAKPAAIELCNDRYTPIDPALPYIASYAEDIRRRCVRSYFQERRAGGQHFDTDAYNVIVRHAMKCPN